MRRARLPAFLPWPQHVAWREGEARLDPVRTAALDDAVLPADAYDLAVAEGGSTLSLAGNASPRLARATLDQVRRQSADAPLPSALIVQDHPALSMRAVHVDLKLHPPRFEWLLSWLDRLAAWKINTVVVEYEDVFPYAAPDIARDGAWTRDQVNAFVAHASELGIEVVPLVQCLGHLEYVLRHERYAHLRETPDALSQACPSNPGTFELFTTMAGELLELHPDARYVHVGADETRLLGACDACAARAAEAGTLGLYLDHVAKVCAWLEERGRRPMVWDDILRSDPASVRRLPKSAVVVYWNYGATGARTDPDKPRFGRPTYDRARAAERRGAERKPWTPPFITYRREGYEVLMAPCFTNGGTVPDVTAVPANCRWHAVEAEAHGCLGVLATNWACLFTPLSLSTHGLAATADAAWNPLPGGLEASGARRPGPPFEFDRRFCRECFGLFDDRLVAALRMMEAGAMCEPGEHGLPTPISRTFFVDPTILAGAAEWEAFCAAFHRTDWDTPARDKGMVASAYAKLDALRTDPRRAEYAGVVASQLERASAGAVSLSRLATEATRGGELLEGLQAGADVRVWRLECVHAALTGRTPPPEPPGITRRLEAFYATSMAPRDARELAAWLVAPFANDDRPD